MLQKENFTFIKDEEENWLIDLPEYIQFGGSKEDLYMIAGADTFLDLISNGSKEVKMKISQKDFQSAKQLHLIELGRIEGPECGTGAWYHLNQYDGLEVDDNFKIWLCPVTKWIFDNYPYTIYFSVFES